MADADKSPLPETRITPSHSHSLKPSPISDLSVLPEHVRVDLIRDYQKGMIDIELKAQQIHVDVAALRSTLGALAGNVNEVAAAGNAVTISHTQTTPIGRTEVIMGNTTQAQTGKLTKSQTGVRDWTPYYIIGGLIAAVLIAALVTGR